MRLFTRRNITVLVLLLVLGLFGIAWLLERCFEDDFVLHGNVEIRQVELSFRVDGRIAEILVDEGERVEKDMVLARLDSDIHEARLVRAQALVDSSKALYERLLAGYRVEEVEQAREQAKSARAQADYARAQLKRISGMRKQNASSQQMLDNAISEALARSADLAAAEQELALHESGYRKEDIEAQRAVLEAAMADAELARISLEDCVLRAPSSGVVLTRAQEEGAIVAAGHPLLTLTLDEPVWLRVYVDEPHLGLVRPGMEVEVFADCRATPFRGRVGYISPSAEFTPKNVETAEVRSSLVYRIRVLAEDPEHMLRQGMPVRVRLLDSQIAPQGD